MSDFDLSKITGRETPIETDDDKDAEIERMRAENERLTRQHDDFAERISFLSSLCIRAVTEGWTVAQVTAELTKGSALDDTLTIADKPAPVCPERETALDDTAVESAQCERRLDA